jgi:mannose/cellobiose epimerase-like protein (N-acyl-D-glucosamine 2-epimerase family)
VSFEPECRSRLTTSHERLQGWLLQEVFPRWARQGIDAQGGFVETIERDGTALAQPRRMRVQPRQVFAFAAAPELGWRTDVRPLLCAGLQYLIRHYQRADGLFRTLINADGGSMDERALLYDQSFALLGYAAAAVALNARAEMEARALNLRHLIEQRLQAADGTFFSDLDHRSQRETNPHMHLLEACLAWAEIGADSHWSRWVRSLVGFGLRRFIRADSGLLGESYTDAGMPSSGIAGRLIEPGHQFEWAWLLLRCDGIDAATRPAALRMIAGAERHGVQNGFAVNALLDDLSVHDAGARFWPQTERLKAALLAAQVTSDPRYGLMACAAAESFFAYFNGDTPGLWFDLRTPDGRTRPSAASASTLYHVVGAVLALHRALASVR